jgi:hypothetical protein
MTQISISAGSTGLTNGGFESNPDFTGWSGAGTGWSIDQDVKYSGNRSAKCSTSGAGNHMIYQTVNTLEQFEFSCQIYVNSISFSGDKIFPIVQLAYNLFANGQIEIRIKKVGSTYKLYCYYYNGIYEANAALCNLVYDTWMKIRIIIKQHASQGFYKVEVNNQLLFELYDIDTIRDNENHYIVDEVRVGYGGGFDGISASATMYFDDVDIPVLYVDAIDFKEEQVWDIAIRNVALREKGQYLDSGTKVVNPKQLSMKLRLSLEERRQLEAIFNAATYIIITANDGDRAEWKYIAWLKGKPRFYEYKTNVDTERDWRAELEFLVSVSGKCPNSACGNYSQVGNSTYRQITFDTAVPVLCISDITFDYFLGCFGSQVTTFTYSDGTTDVFSGILPDDIVLLLDRLKFLKIIKQVVSGGGVSIDDIDVTC